MEYTTGKTKRNFWSAPYAFSYHVPDGVCHWSHGLDHFCTDVEKRQTGRSLITIHHLNLTCMNTKEVLSELKKAGSEQTKKIFLKHGAKEPFYGVKIEDLKKIQKKIKENQQQVALELFETGIGDAQYLAGLMANGAKMNKKELQAWAEAAEWPMISEYAVAWVACENENAWRLV